MADGLDTSSTIVPKSGMGLYIHVPFCKTKCPYCDFNTYQGIEGLMDPYLQALSTELGLWGRVLGRPPVNTVFFGGGTPSTFSPMSIGKILEKAESLFPFERDIEVTLEANPGTVDSANFAGYHASGVNRISIGAQRPPSLAGVRAIRLVRRNRHHSRPG